MRKNVQMLPLKVAWLLMLFIFSIGNLLSQGTIQIGSGTTTTTTYPLSSCWGYSYTQQIYLASEFASANGVAGDITSMRFYFSSGTINANWTDNWVVYIGHTAQSEFASTTDWVPLANLTEVYNGSVAPVAGNWLEITFSTPFNYDGTSNIVIAVDENTSNYTCSANWRSFSPTTNNRGIYYRSDSVNPDPASPPTGVRSGTAAISQIQFEGQLATCILPTLTNATNLTTNSATINWDEASPVPANGYEWEVRTSGSGGSGAVGLVSSGITAALSENVTGLDASTSYSYFVRSDCGGGDYSAWAGPIDFATLCASFTAVYTQNFDGVSTPNIPQCWSSIVISSSTFATVRTITSTSPNSAPNHVEMYNSATAGATSDLMLVSPQFSDLPGGINQIRFFAKRGTNAENLIIGTLTDPNDPLTFTEWTTISDLTNAYQEYTVSFFGYAGTDEYIAFKHGNSSSTRYVYIDDVVWEPLPACPQPNDLSVSNLSATTADFTWTAGALETTWNVEWGSTGFTPGTGTEIGSDVVSTSNTTVSGLNPTTTYEFYVQADCGGDQSMWTGPITFTTLCTPYTATYTQNFDGVSTPNIPQCWSSIIESSSTFAAVRTITSVTPNSAPNHVEMYNSATTGATSNLMLVSPQFSDLPDATNQIRFFAKRGTNAENLIIGTLTDPSDPLTFTEWTTITDLTNAYQEYMISFGTYTGTDEFIAFKHGNSVATRYVYIDDVVWEPIPSCPQPTSVAISDISIDGAIVSWTPGGLETEWVIEYGTSGFTQGTGTSFLISTLPYEISGLDSGTEYDVYIQAVCAVEDSSNWTGPSTFTTALSCGDTYVDNGGTDGNYLSNSNVITTICAENEGDYVQITFTDFQTETNWDGIYVFDGNDITSPMIASTNSAGNGPMTQPGAYWGGTIPGPFYSTNPEGCLTFHFLSDGSVQQAGFVANIECFPCTPNPGVDGATDVCRLDETVDLSTVATEGEDFGVWTFDANPSLLNGSTLNIAALPSGTFVAQYIVTTACDADTTIATVNVYGESKAGNNGVVQTCNYGPLNLFDGLTGTVDLGGTWYDPAGNPLSGTIVNFNGQIPANYNYYYITSNNVCPADTAFVEVQLQNCASITENELSGFALYPNPTSDIVNVQYSGNATTVDMVLVDTKGSVIYSEKANLASEDKIEIDLSKLVKGVYFLSIYGEEGSKVIKVVRN